MNGWRVLSPGILCAAVALAADPASAICAKPILPYCASDGTLGGKYVSKLECRRHVTEHLAELSRYRECLKGDLRQLNGEIERLNHLLTRSSGSGAAQPGAS